MEALRWHRRSEEHTSELQSPDHLVCRLLLEKKKQTSSPTRTANTTRATMTFVPHNPNPEPPAQMPSICTRKSDPTVSSRRNTNDTRCSRPYIVRSGRSDMPVSRSELHYCPTLSLLRLSNISANTSSSHQVLLSSPFFFFNWTPTLYIFFFFFK